MPTSSDYSRRPTAYGPRAVGSRLGFVSATSTPQLPAQSKKPITFYDTERGSGFTAALFRAAGIKAKVVRSRSFKDLLAALKEAQEISDVFLADSISHPWRELMKSYKKAKRRDFISIRDWGPLKESWHDGWSIPYVNSELHIIMCGRSANVFEDIEEQRGNKTETKSVKVGTKMSTEGETGYEPNLLIEMRRMLAMDGGVYSHEAAVLKDRSFLLDGCRVEWTMPKDDHGIAQLDVLLAENKPFHFILPHILSLNLGKAAAGIRNSSSENLFPEGSHEREKLRSRRAVELAEILAIFEKWWPGQSGKNKKAKADFAEGISIAMGTRCRAWETIKESWTDDQVHTLYHAMLGITARALRQLEKALKLGPDEDAAPEAVADVARQYWEGKFEPKVTDDLPV